MLTLASNGTYESVCLCVSAQVNAQQRRNTDNGALFGQISAAVWLINRSEGKSTSKSQKL